MSCSILVCSFYVGNYISYLLNWVGGGIVHVITLMFLLHNVFWYSPTQGQQIKFISVAHSGAVFDSPLYNITI